MPTKDWAAWHEPYADKSSPLSHRLRIVQSHVSRWLDERTEERLTVVSACAGDGRDLLGALAARSDAHRVTARLVEADARLADRAREAAPPGVHVHCGDAGLLESYAAAVPADLVLMCGVFGNISDDDVRQTIGALPRLCAAGATVIWTRSRRDPDLTPDIRAWFGEVGFGEVAFEAPGDVVFSVGVHRFTGLPADLGSGAIFTFA